MPTVCLILEYEGTDYSGWQIQTDPPLPTIQGELERALQEILQLPVRARAASRTDAGVHARGQVVAFDVDKELPLSAYERGLNTKLPRDIVVRKAELVAPSWSPKHNARGKRYRYTYWNDRQPTALLRRFSWYVPQAMDVAKMQAAAELLLGTHDFESFRSTGCPAKHAIRTMYRVEVARRPDGRVVFEIVGNAFCRNMVRIFAGTLRDIGIGRTDRAELEAILEAKDRTRAGQTAPPTGLVLEEVIYDERLPPRPDGSGGDRSPEDPR